MKKFILAAVLSSVMIESASSAVVTIDTFDSFPGTTEYTTTSIDAYGVGADLYDVVLNQERVSANSNLAAEEIIYLGAHESTGSNSGSNVIDVNVFNANAGSGATGRVSFVISAAENTTWNFDVDAGVDIRNIFIFAPGDDSNDLQTVNISQGESVFSQSFGLGQLQTFEGATIERSQESVCGFESPGDPQGCNTDLILGDNNDYMQGFLLKQSNPDDENFLKDLLGNDNGVSSFNASYFVESFNVTIDSTPIPLPAAFYLFASALAFIASMRKFA